MIMSRIRRAGFALLLLGYVFGGILLSSPAEHPVHADVEQGQ